MVSLAEYFQCLLTSDVLNFRGPPALVVPFFKSWLMCSLTSEVSTSGGLSADAGVKLAAETWLSVTLKKSSC